MSLCGPALGALVYSLCPLTWEYHTQAEVFALNNLLLATLVRQDPACLSNALVKEGVHD